MKPIFYVFILLVSAWLTLLIEQISPSDFERKPHFFQIEKLPTYNQKQKLMNLCYNFHEGLIDSVKLDAAIDLVLNPEQNNTSFQFVFTEWL